MVSRRGLFRLLSGAALSPALKPLMFLAPEEAVVDIIPNRIGYTTYLVGSNALCAADIRRCVQSLRNANVRPLPNSNYSGFIHPDFVNLETGELYDYPKRRTL